MAVSPNEVHVSVKFFTKSLTTMCLKRNHYNYFNRSSPLITSVSHVTTDGTIFSNKTVPFYYVKRNVTRKNVDIDFHSKTSDQSKQLCTQQLPHQIIS